MNIAPSSVHLRKVLHDGQEALDKAHADAELPLRGAYRAGSCGTIVGAEVLGECHRVAHARWLGHDKPVDPDRKIMFAGGEGNEDLWKKVVVPGWHGRVLHGERLGCDFEWGRVLGTTDLVLADEHCNWDTVLELKLVCSTNTAIYRGVVGEPDLKHLIQSCVYMWLSGKPVILCYTSRSDFAVEFSRKKLGISKVEPFYKLFYLELRDGQLYYRDEWKTETVATAITVGGVERYYKFLAEMADKKTLGPRPSNKDVHGEEAKWNKCDAKYCVFSETCDDYEHDYNTWADAVRVVCAKY